MLRLLFTKWWVVLIQGILLILLSFFLFNHPGGVLAGLSIWFGLGITATGVLGVLSWFGAGKQEREEVSLLWSILTTLLGLVLLFNLLATMKLLTILFGLWMLLTGFRLIRAGWLIKDVSFLGWIMMISGAFSAVIAFVIMFNLGLGAIGISTVVGLQVLIAGLGMIVLALVKKSVRGKVRDRVEELRSKI